MLLRKTILFLSAAVFSLLTSCTTRYQDMLRERDERIRELSGQVAQMRGLNEELERRSQAAPAEATTPTKRDDASGEMKRLQGELGDDVNVSYRGNRLSIGVNDSLTFDSGSTALKDSSRGVLRGVASASTRRSRSVNSGVNCHASWPRIGACSIASEWIRRSTGACSTCSARRLGAIVGAHRRRTRCSRIRCPRSPRRGWSRTPPRSPRCGRRPRSSSPATGRRWRRRGPACMISRSRRSWRPSSAAAAARATAIRRSHLRSSEIYYSVSNKANYELTSDNRYLQDIKTGRAELGTKGIQVTHIFRGNMPDQREFLSIDINYNHKATIFNIGTDLIAAEHVETILPKLMRTLHTLNHLESNCAKLEHEDNVGLATEIIKRVSGNAGDNTPSPAPNL